MEKALTFDLYRYQLLPLSRGEIQHDLYRESLTPEQLISKKNEIFGEVLRQTENFDHRGRSVRRKIILDQGDWFGFKLGVQKSVEREDEDFEKEKIESWPHVNVIINNDPGVQVFAISRNARAFSDSAVVSRFLEDNYRNKLGDRGLYVAIEGIFEKQDFWRIVEEHAGHLASIKFELISPNMANISKALTLDLKQINNDTNSHKTNFELNAANNSSLEVSKESKVINGLVNYASEGGGDISIKVRGLKATLHTQTSTKTVEIDELEMEHLSVDVLKELDIFS